MKTIIDIKAKIVNGRLIIESKTDKGSDELDKWIEDNKTFLDKRLDIEIIAYETTN